MIMRIQLCALLSVVTSTTSNTIRFSTAFVHAHSFSPFRQRDRLRARHAFVLAAMSSDARPSDRTAATTPTTSTTAVAGSLGKPTPPVAKRDEARVILAGVLPTSSLPRQSKNSGEPLMDPSVEIADPYGWLRDEERSDPAVLEHLNAENSYTTAMTEHLKGLQDKIYTEMVSALQETDYTTPRSNGPDYYYYSRTFQGKSYTVHCRAPKLAPTGSSTSTGSTLSIAWDGSAESPILPNEQILLDVNVLAENKSYCATGSVKISPTHELLAYSTDFVGGETCQLFVKNIATGEVQHDPELEIDGSIVWGSDDNTLFYLKLDATHRPYQLYRRYLNDDSKPDELLFEEPDGLYWMGIHKSLDGKYLFMEVSSKETTEIHFLDLESKDDSTALQCVAPRRSGVLYEVEHRNNYWWIASNVGKLPNLALFVSPAISNSADEWRLVEDKDGNALFDGGLERSLSDVVCFRKHVVAHGREGGLPRIWVMSGIDEQSRATVQSCDRLLFAEDAYDVGMGTHYEFDTDQLVVVYDSMVTPTQSLQFDMNNLSKAPEVLKEKQVPGYDRSQFACERLTVTARDGKTEIPVSMVYRKDVMEEHLKSKVAVPVHLYGYGSYGACMEADFSSTRLPLLQRGMVYVIAHVRGGGEMGRQWYEEPNGAKYLCKKNTFSDFVDVAKWLVEERKLTSPTRLSCEGRSAGGMLIGSSVNQAPELFRVAILGVPFVDVVCTMIDASIPLTEVEWEEWGCPNEAKYFGYMMEYCPMQNVNDAVYPSMLLTGGLHDPRVQYWEPAKFVATLRHTQNPTSGPVCLKMDMSAGHFSASDRYKYLKELAFDYCFLLDQLGLANE